MPLLTQSRKTDAKKRAARFGRARTLPRNGRLQVLLLLGSLAFGLLALVPVVLALELLDAAGGVHELHLAGEERVADRADFDVDILACAAGHELVAATAGHGRFHVFRVNAFFHDPSLIRDPVDVGGRKSL